jgi:signal transduction histidine kinase
VEGWALLEQPLLAAIADAVHGTVRDVLREVERQASARTVSIALTVAARRLRLTVSDSS